ncbi:E3 ubiquitin-protein ligase WAV3 [Phoenix dactylifera]|uniref:E3 ubiquitin-protein ligase WAV3 n=1 Tax=Phoenix dactylifera TaxID=42345 RepID=A0A8B9ASY4_PHODC|nr:E3 ubiquitin-protein ligase WAV3 [Phoenix dactylifera]
MGKAWKKVNTSWNQLSSSPLREPPRLRRRRTPPHPSLSPTSPTAAVAIETLPEFPAIAAASSPSSFTVLIKARAPPLPTHDGRAALDLVAVLDVSHSMEGRKLALVKHAVGFIIRSLTPADRLAIVAFSNTTNRVLGLRLMSDAGRAEAANAINSLVACGGTDIAGGLSVGIRILEERRFRNPVTSIILLSDGIDTMDRSSLAGLHGSSRTRAFLHRLPPTAHSIGPIHTFGFGADHDPGIMHAVAEATCGTFSFVEKEEAVSDAFAACLAGLLSVVAQRVQMNICSASPGVYLTSVATGNYSSSISDHRLTAVISVGDLYAEEEKYFLLDVTVPIKEEQKDPWTPLEERTTVRRPASLSPEDESANLIVDGQRNRILVAESIAEAQAKADGGDLEGAKAVLDARRAALVASSSAQAGNELCAWLDKELKEIRDRMANRRAYEESGRAYMLSGMSSHSWQRAALRGQTTMLSSAPTAVTFRTQAMAEMLDRSREWSRASPLLVDGRSPAPQTPEGRRR